MLIKRTFLLSFTSPRFTSPRFTSPRFTSPRFTSPRFTSPRFTVQSSKSSMPNSAAVVKSTQFNFLSTVLRFDC